MPTSPQKKRLNQAEERSSNRASHLNLAGFTPRERNRVGLPNPRPLPSPSLPLHSPLSFPCSSLPPKGIGRRPRPQMPPTTATDAGDTAVHRRRCLHPPLETPIVSSQTRLTVCSGPICTTAASICAAPAPISLAMDIHAWPTPPRTATGSPAMASHSQPRGCQPRPRTATRASLPKIPCRD
jgi:hypothetical protein